MHPKDTVAASRAAVETGCVVLYEIEDGRRRLIRRVGKRKPVEEYLRFQARYRHVVDDPDALAQIQAQVDESFEATVARCA